MKPDLPECAANIPAMTTEEERQAYYRLTREAVERGGEIVELGAWLGASTAYIAAAIRDGGGSFVNVFDRFISKPAHIAKQQSWYGGQTKIDPVEGPTVETFRSNLGSLNDFVLLRQGEIRRMKWSGERIALLVSDAPKRVPEISYVLTEFAGALDAGSVMAWQDFAYFASYDIPACLSRLGDHIEFVEVVYPGTTGIFRVVRPWAPEQVTKSALRIHNWSADEVEARWAQLAMRLPEEARPRFSCGAIMFLYDIGAGKRAVKRLREVLAGNAPDVVPKWQYFRKQRPDFIERYHGLFAEIP